MWIYVIKREIIIWVRKNIKEKEERKGKITLNLWIYDVKKRNIIWVGKNIKKKWLEFHGWKTNGGDKSQTFKVWVDKLSIFKS